MYDEEYKRLRKNGYLGWGGERSVRRLAGWTNAVSRLAADPIFPRPPSRIIELGSGNGLVASLFARRGYTVQGVDISEEAVSWANELFAFEGLEGNFLFGNVCAMPFYESGSFDAAIDGNCLHCLIGADRTKCLAEVIRILRPGGVLFVSTMCGPPRSEEACTLYNQKDLTLTQNGIACRALLPPSEIEQEISAAGFEIIWREVAQKVPWDHMTMIAVVK